MLRSAAVAKDEAPEILTIDGREVRVTHPSKPYFTAAKVTKLDLVRYFLAVGEGALRGIRDRPIVLKRFVDGAESEAFYQKRAPPGRPEWIRTTTLRFPSGRTAEEVVVDDTAGLAWIANLGCIELHPHAVRTGDLDRPDELRVDLDPGPGVEWEDVRRVAEVARAVLDDHGLQGFPKTSGSRGMHIIVRIEPRWGFDEVRRAALALAREVERRAPTLATSKWWKEERHGVFLDYNQNAKDRTTCSAYSVRPLPDARVSAPLRWDEVGTCNPADFTMFTVPNRYRELGDPHAESDAVAYSLEKLLELAARDDAAGLGDAPWPPHYEKKAGEAPRVQPSRKKKAPAGGDATAGLASETGEAGEAGEVDATKAPKPPRARKTRESTMPLVIVANAKKKDDALAGLERWKTRHPAAAALLAIDDVLVDSMRGRSSSWTRIRVNLRHVPEAERPPQETPDPDYDPKVEWMKLSLASPDDPSRKSR